MMRLTNHEKSVSSPIKALIFTPLVCEKIITSNNLN